MNIEQRRIKDFLENEEIGFNDVILAPKNIVRIKWSDVDLSTRLTKRITLANPLMSSPMDTVTEAEMAILLAKLGGIGVIHNNNTVDEQMWEIEKVRRWEAGFIRNPVVLPRDAILKDYVAILKKYNISSQFITEDGTLNSKLVGVITENDVCDTDDLTVKVGQLMTPVSEMTTEPRETTLDKNDIKTANKIIRERKMGALPIVDRDGKLVALVTRSDLLKNKTYPDATKDENKQLKVLIAVEATLDDLTKERIDGAKQTGASGIVLDQRNTSLAQLADVAEWARKHAPDLDIISGNVVTEEATREMLGYFGGLFDAIRVGIGGGNLCRTTEDLNFGRALPASVRAVKRIVRIYEKKLGFIGVIGDGGMLSPGHVTTIMMFGADAAMFGSLLSGYSQSPHKEWWDEEMGMLVKRARGMGSRDVMVERAGADRYMQDKSTVEERWFEGVEKKVPFMGDGEPLLRQFLNGLRNNLHGLNCKDYHELRVKMPAYPKRMSSSKGSLFK